MADLTEDDTLIQEPLLANNNRNNEGTNTITNTLNLDIEEEEEIFLSRISDVPYKTYAKFVFYFLRWPLAVCIIDVVLSYIADDAKVSHAYGDYYYDKHRRQWIQVYGNVEPIIVTGLILNTIFLFLSANAIDRDITILENERRSDHSADQENLTNDESARVENNTLDWNNYEHIYGRVARKLDVWLVSACQTTPRTNAEPIIPTGTAYLSHLCWITWVFCFAGSYSHMLELAKNHLTPPPLEATNNDITKVPPFASIIPPPQEATNNFARIKGYENISEIPEDLLPWIHSDPKQMYTIPIQAKSSRRNSPMRDQWHSSGHSLAIMTDRIFIVGSSNYDSRLMEDERDGLHEIITINNTFTTRYYNDIYNPHLFIPIESYIDENNPSIASMYCFLSGNYKVHCTMENNGQELDLKNATLDWESHKQEDFFRHRLRVASYQKLLFVMIDSGMKNYEYKEVIKVDPTTMETSKVVSGEFIRKKPMIEPMIEGGKKRSYSSFGFFNTICGLGFATYYLISKRGIISGFFTLTFTVVLILDFCNLSIIIIVFGMGYFPYVIYSCDGTTPRRIFPFLPVWNDKNVLIWESYGWNFAFAFGFDVMSYICKGEDLWLYDANPLGMFSLILNSLILGHPGLQVIGYIYLVFAIFHIRNPYRYPLLVYFSFGFAYIIIGKFFSKYKWTIYTRSRYIMRCLLRWYKNRFGNSSSPSTANFRHE